MPTTNFPNGSTNVTAQSCTGQMIQQDPSVMHTFFTDFDTYAADNWIVSETDAAATQALTDADNGVLLITNTATDNDLVAIQKVGESFTFSANKQLFFKARFKVSDATQSDLVIGLQILDTTPLAVSNGVFFIKGDGVATMDFKVGASSTFSTASAVATLVDDTYITVGFYYDGGLSGFINYFASTNATNPLFIGRLAVTNLPTTELTVSFAIQNGEAVAKTMSIDYILASKER